MNRDELIAIAKDAGIWIPDDANCETFITTIDELNKFAVLIAEPLKSKLAVIEDGLEANNTLNEALKKVDENMIAELQAHINKLREALACLYPGMVLDLRYADIENDDLNAMQSRIDTIEQALAETLSQSLKEHDDAVKD